jgi:rare lipoprotein A
MAPGLLPNIYSEQGIASWYGLPFHGRRASDGEIFDMNQLVAAHRTLPFGTIVRVTNLSNGMQVDVRIIDRGPFVAGRVIDLSLAAAQAINMVGPGTASVKLELVSGPQPPAAGIFTVQVGAFQERDNADRLRARLLARYPDIFFQEFDAPAGHFYRVLVGRLANEQAAEQEAAKLASEDGLQTFVVRVDTLQ